MIRYSITLICILLFYLCSTAQIFHPSSFYKGDRRIAFKDSTMLIVGGVYDGNNVWPCYWENSKKVMLGNEPGYANGILVEEDNIYISGFILKEDNIKACYWKNDSLVLLPGENGLTYSIAISNSDIYIVGELQKSYESYPCYWKNGKLNKLSELNGEATSVSAPNNGDLYFAGSVGSSAVSKAVYWKNGEINKLSKFESAVNSIYVSNNDVYIIGELGASTRGKCLKNNEKYKLMGKVWYLRTIRDINDDIYIGGCGGGLGINPCYWKNSKQYKLEDTKGMVISIEEHNSDIYFLNLYVLNDKLEFSYWKNGEKIILEN